MSFTPWNDKDGCSGHSPRQLPIASLIYLQRLRDWLLTAILMRNSAVIAWGERQAFSSRKRKSAHCQAKCCRSLSMWLAVCPLFCPLSCSQGGFGAPLPSSPFSFLIVGVSDPFLFPTGDHGRAMGRGLQYSVHVFQGVQCDNLGDRSLLTGSGAAQQPVTTVDQLGVHSAIHLFRVTMEQRKKRMAIRPKT